MVYLFLADGFEEIEALTQVDYLRRAGIEIKTCSVSGEMYVIGSKGIVVKADMSLSEASVSEADMIILPGGLGGVDGIKSSETAISMIKEAAEKGIRISAICAAPTLLAGLGILKGRKCVCYPSMLDMLHEGGGVVCEDKAVVCDGNIITAKAAGASEQFSFAIISALKGDNAANAVRESICAR